MFVDDFRDLLVNDSSISGEFGSRMYFLALDANIDKTKKWLRWGYTETANIQAIGCGIPRPTYNVYIDVIMQDPNTLVRTGEIVKERVLSAHGNNMGKISYVGNSFTSFMDTELVVETLNFSITYRG